MKLAIVGTKSNVEYSMLEEAMRGLNLKPKEIISTGEKGVAELASLYAKYNSVKHKEFVCDWKTQTPNSIMVEGQWGPYNRLAAKERDEQLLGYVDSVLIIEPNGDKNFTELAARKLGKNVFVYKGPVDLEETVNF